MKVRKKGPVVHRPFSFSLGGSANYSKPSCLAMYLIKSITRHE